MGALRGKRGLIRAIRVESIPWLPILPLDIHMSDGKGPIKLKRVFQYCGMILMLGAVILLFFVSLKAFRQQQTANWIETEGTVLNADYFEYGSRRSERGAARIRIKYQYKVVGNAYTSDQIVLGDSEYKRDADQLNRFVQLHPQGSKIKVFHNPKAPENAVVFVGIDWMSVMSNGGLGAAGLLAGYILATKLKFTD
jgi:hypothetical protein